MHPLPSPGAWNLDPIAIVGLLALLVGFWAVVGPLTRRYAPDHAISRGRAIAFLVGWLLLVITVISPLDTLGRYYLFSAHAFQVFMIVTCVTPLVLAGLPEWTVWTVLRTRDLRNATRGLGFAALAILLYNGIVLIWHVGPLYEASLQSTPLHDLSLLCFFVAGIFGWWPMLTPLDRHTRLASPSQIIYVALNSLPLDIFGVFALFAGHLFYPLYATAPIIFGLPHDVDQAVAGGILAVPNSIVDIVIMSLAFFGWMRRAELAQMEREREEFGEDLAEIPLDSPAINPADAQ